jgi:tetratricopeptide (TPR) repeat protein
MPIPDSRYAPQRPQNLGRRRRKRGFSFVRAFLRLWRAITIRGAAIFVSRVLVLAAVVAGGGTLALRFYRAHTTRTLNLCVASDFYYRDQKPDWRDGLDPLFREVNERFRGAGVLWEFTYAGDAYPVEPEKSMAERTELLADVAGCRNADVILGLTGRGERRGSSSVAPFAHSLLVAVTAADPDALAAKVVARALANLFGVLVDAQTLIATDAAPGELFDPASIELIARMRGYDFARGISALPGAWEARALSAIAATVAARSPSPAVDAHRILGRAYAFGRRHGDAVRQFGEAAKASPRDFAVRFEYAMGLAANAESEEAIAELRACAALDPEDARPHAAMGAIYLNSQRVDEAVDAFRAATRIDPRNAGYQAAFGEALLQQPGRLRDADAAFQTAVRLRPNEGGAFSRLALLGRMREELADAAVRPKPGSADAHLKAGVVRAYAGDLEGAEKEFRRSIELEPASRAAAHLAMARLKYLRGDLAAVDSEVRTAEALGATPSLSLRKAIQRKLAE